MGNGKPYEIIPGHVLDVLRSMSNESIHCIVTSPPYFGLRDYKVEPQIWGNHNGCQHEWGNVALPAANGQILEPMLAATLNPPASAGSFGVVSTKPKMLLDPFGIPQSASRSPRNSSFCRKCPAWRGHLGLEPTPELYIEHLAEVFREAKRVLRRDGTLWLNLGDTYWGSTGQAGNLNKTLEKNRALGKTLQRRETLMDTDWVPQTGSHPVLKPKTFVAFPGVLPWPCKPMAGICEAT